MIITPGDIDIGWRTVWMEARGEPYEGMKAVTHVILNRVKYRTNDRWNTIAQVCLDWLQFSGWRENDPNFAKAMSLDLNDVINRQCLRAFLEAIDEPDITKGARHYHASYMLPSWVDYQKPCYVIGRHLFYNNIK